MDLEKIESLIKLMRAHGLHEIKLKEGADVVRITQSAPTSAAQVPVIHSPSVHVPFEAMPSPSKTKSGEEGSNPKKTHAKENLIEVRSPFVGTYYASSAPGADPFVRVQQKVRKGDTLCIVEAMKLMNEIEAERDGEIVEILVDNEQPVEYDQVLFLMK